ncbi:2'-5' RNA ligase [Sinobacterium caligoides]|uniref:RNA 2',3'-cyclic phosphodiesterase n=1 Tax=Sinobacterium caligoides TaxID=933926 RepID=A0A3N2D5I6_9GAMM|nr:2'-5' RNA ligase [Sinobacterium caligoides]
MVTAQRLFIAIPLLPDLAQQLCQMLPQYGDDRFGSWQAERNLHLTLLFLGEQGEAEPVIELMEQSAAACHHLDFTADSLALLPAQNAARQLWAFQPQPNSVLMQLQTQLAERFTAAGLYASSRAYLPHITLLRGNAACPLPLPLEPVDGFALSVNRMVLYRSSAEALPDGGEWRHYEPLHTTYLSV